MGGESQGWWWWPDRDHDEQQLRVCRRERRMCHVKRTWRLIPGHATGAEDQPARRTMLFDVRHDCLWSAHALQRHIESHSRRSVCAEKHLADTRAQMTCDMCAGGSV